MSQYRWAEGKGLAIDVAVTTQKHGKYDASFEGPDYFFAAIIFETLGTINVEGEEVSKQLFRFAAKRL